MSASFPRGPGEAAADSGPAEPLHIGFFTDQHPATLGGLQVSLRAQRGELERLGHRVTVCGPLPPRRPAPGASGVGAEVRTPSARVGAHAVAFTGRAGDRRIDAGFFLAPPVDLVHVQGDVWGAWAGYRFAARHGLPLVHTMHTSLDAGLPTAFPFPELLLRMLFRAQRRHLGAGPVAGIGDYLRAFGSLADAVIAPSGHLAERLRALGVTAPIRVIPTGVAGAELSELPPPPAPAGRPVFVWPGRLSPEKRLPELLAAVAAAGIDAEVHVYGEGPALGASLRAADRHGLGSRVRFLGAVSHERLLAAMRAADAVLQSSLGYETQGLTVFEAIAVGTPVLVRDPRIAAELPAAWVSPVAGPGQRELIAALRGLHAAARAGTLRPGEPPPDLTQAARTAEILAVYRAALADRPAARLPPGRASA